VRQTKIIFVTELTLVSSSRNKQDTIPRPSSQNNDISDEQPGLSHHTHSIQDSHIEYQRDAAASSVTRLNVSKSNTGASASRKEKEKRHPGWKDVVEDSAPQSGTEEGIREWVFGWGPGDRSHEYFRRLFQDLYMKRSNLASSRLNQRSTRRRLRKTRDALDERENQFMQTLMAIVLGIGEKNLHSLKYDLDQLQEARNTFRSEEDEYDKLEADLLADEYELKVGEQRLYRWIDESPMHQSSDEQVAVVKNRVVSSDSSMSTHRASLGVAVVTQQLSAGLRDREILQSCLRKLEAEYYHLLSEKEMRAFAEMPLDENSEDFLREYPTRSVNLRRELEILDQSLSQIQQMQNKQSNAFFLLDQFLDPDLDPDLDLDLDLDSALQEMHNPDGPKTKTIRDPLLLPDDDITLVFGTSTTNQWIPTDLFINSWLLDQLRRSILEVHRYKSQDMLNSVLKSVNGNQQQFAELVLKFWPRDDAFAQYDNVLEDALSIEPSNLTDTVRSRIFETGNNRQNSGQIPSNPRSIMLKPYSSQHPHSYP
jgi:hypothetical protein